MNPNIIVLDLETKFSFDEVGGRQNLGALGISVAGLFDYKSGRYKTFEENELGELETLLSERQPLVVGFNVVRFDAQVLKPYLHFDPTALPMLDIMTEIENVLGHRVSLESVARATLGTGKTGTGMDAISFYKNGEMKKLKEYCLNDVKVTKELYEYGAKHKELFYMTRDGLNKARAGVNWEIVHPEGEEGGAQLTLF